MMNIMEERIIKQLANEQVTYVFWDEYETYCYRTENVEFVQAVLNSKPITLTDSEKTMYELKYSLLLARLENLKMGKQDIEEKQNIR